MKTCFTLSLFAVLVVALAIPVQAQVDYDTVADLAFLMDEGQQSDIEIDCMDAIDIQAVGGEFPVFIFYNEATGDLVGHNPNATLGNRTFVIVDSATLDAQLGGDVTDCRALTVTPFGDIYAALAVGGIDFVYSVNIAGALDGGGGTVLAEADGITGIAVDVAPAAGGFPPIYLALVEFFGAPEDGFYELVVPTGSSGGFPLVPVEVYTDPDLDLYDLDLFAQQFLVSNSSEFGNGGAGLQNVVVAFDLGGKGGGFEIIYDPFTDGIFVNPTDGGIEDVEVVGFGGGETSLLGGGGDVGIYLFNNSFFADDGEQWGVTFSDVGGVRFAEETPLLADPDVDIPCYQAADGTHMVTMDDGTIYVASTDAFGCGDAILVFYGAPIPVELVSFNAVVDGQSVTLNWETASETNNAGFEVQMRQGETWNALGFVEGHGTTTEAQEYSFSTDLLPGTYAFRLKQIDFDGQFEYFGGVEATVGTPSTHLLSSVYPNPFNPQASFDLAVAQTQHVTVELYNVLGQRVATLFNATMEADANQTFTIDGAGLATGQYVVRVTGESFAESRTVTLLK